MGKTFREESNAEERVKAVYREDGEDKGPVAWSVPFLRSLGKKQCMFRKVSMCSQTSFFL